MKIRSVDAPDAPRALGGYSQVCEVSGAQRFAFVSGQIPESVDGDTPGTFAEQCRLIWRNIEAQLRAADMTLDNVVKVTTFLSDRQFAAENRAVREQVLGDRSPALTVIIAGIFDSAWLLEIEVVAAA
jgi:2-iminobutanoate/2-iminopropanoate deaminase